MGKKQMDQNGFWVGTSKASSKLAVKKGEKKSQNTGRIQGYLEKSGERGIKLALQNGIFVKRFGSKEDLVPRPQDQPIRDPKSAKPSNVTTEPYVPKVFSVPSQPADPLETKPNIVKKDPLEAKANLQQRLARVSEQFATNSKKDPLETDNDSKKDSAQNYNGIPCELDLVQLEIPKKDDKMLDAPTLDAPLHVQQQRQPPDAKEILVNATMNLREYKLPYGWSKTQCIAFNAIILRGTVTLSSLRRSIS